jgi:hypothetical protein
LQREREEGTFPTPQSRRESKHIIKLHNSLSSLVPLCHQTDQ